MHLLNLKIEMKKIIIVITLFLWGKNVFAQTTVAKRLEGKKTNVPVFQKTSPAFTNRKMAYARSYNNKKTSTKSYTASKSPIVRTKGQRPKRPGTFKNYKVTVNRNRYHINKTSISHQSTIKKTQ